MENSPPVIWEDDEYVYVPEELFKHLPPEYLEAVEARKQQGSNILQIADNDIKSLIRLANAIPTTAVLSYIYHRLRTAKFDRTIEALMEQEMLTTAFVVTYSRLFVSGNGGSGVARDQIPAPLRAVHDDLIEIRHQRYAHNGGHETISSGVRIDFDDTEVRINLQVSLGLYVGGRDEWDELVTFLNAHMHERIHKILGRLKAKTGYDWKFPVGPAPAWISKSN
ncbi:hypothetical protein NKY66_10980 [Sinorhizobium meliloti]|uniref:hypothetical protein n=1 Tax=Rhizobium meliloti TaxID=382 RepID=UPI003D6534BF